MDEHEEHEGRESTADAEPITERVRIIGAELASEAAVPETVEEERRQDQYLGFHQEAQLPAEPPPPPVFHESEASGASVGQQPELLHWSDPPTGQVPAVLDRRGDDEGDEWSGADTGPVWREHRHEWADTGGFEPAMLADDATRVGALEETPLEQRRPWEFGELAEEATGEPAEEATEEPAGQAEGSWWEQGPQADRPDTPAAPGSGPPEPDAARPPELVGGRPTHRRQRRPQVPEVPTRRNVPVAAATGVAFAALGFGCFALGPLATVVLATVVVALASAECFAALRRGGMRPATLLGLVATVAVMVSAYAKGVSALPLVLFLVVATSMVWYLVGAERGAPLEGISATVLGFAWVGLFGSFAALLVAPSIYPQRHGVAFLLGAVVATVGEDVGALAVGTWLGRHQLAPHVSPNKTWEGTLGGAAVAIAASVLVTGQVHPWTPGKAAILGAVIAVVAPIGDLCESLVKRDLGLKDMGSILPGHGGVLDRVDALLFALPVTYYLVRLLNLG